MTPKDITTKYLGVPYKHMGRTMAGLDCWGLIKLVYADIGVDVADLDNYELAWARKGHGHFESQKYPEWKRVENPQFLDVVLFKATETIVNHAGLVLDERRFIHCCRAGVVVARLGDLQWFKRTVGFYRLKK